ncbi:high nitrogen upregulated cytochrome P450 monooxygenase 2 [Crucibulum laeve]|uniref:High nitrogen upregulated cytochrome P450 monooxygenase 2 n=1 Tax=Crucibulum laeve TaxID=68775 RepID=A0A5C3LWF8_9AGAR|nr:high nitrogen upregulated cytochrome P450 monooxygenase 2 [Crucibulum laeve]
MYLSYSQALQVNVVSALAAHLWFKNFEPIYFVLRTAFTLAIIPLPSAFFLSPHFSSIIFSILAAYSVFYTTLLLSIVLYRISPIHPLSKYPGPVICKVTKFWGAWIAIGGKTHEYTKHLHEEYGPVVRIGPNELSIVERDLIPSILGTQGMPKGPLWVGRRFGHAGDPNQHDSLIDIRDLQEHGKLRKAWNKAFSNEPLKDYEEILIGRVNQLSEELQRICANSTNGVGCVDIAQWLSFFSFDYMGDIGFGGGFNLMREGDHAGLWHSMETGMYLPSIVQHIPWIGRFTRNIPFIADALQGLIALGVEQATKRGSGNVQKKDFFYHLIAASELDDSPESFQLIISNAILTIVAGSDTTAAVLSNVVYNLLSSKSDYDQLRKEIDQSLPLGDMALIDSEKLASLSFLNAVINETLRLQPAVPTTLQRAPAVGSGGKLLGSMFITEGTAVQVPPYTIHRDSRYFSPNPEKFWPERWISKDRDIILDKGAFIPFSAGPADCAGKRLAIVEMRYVVAMLVKNFDMAFDDGYDPAQWEKDLVDRFVFSKGKLPVKVVKRGVV